MLRLSSSCTSSWYCSAVRIVTVITIVAAYDLARGPQTDSDRVVSWKQAEQRVPAAARPQALRGGGAGGAGRTPTHLPGTAPTHTTGKQDDGQLISHGRWDSKIRDPIYCPIEVWKRHVFYAAARELFCPLWQVHRHLASAGVAVATARMGWRAWEVDLMPGDLLFLPPMYIHQVMGHWGHLPQQTRMACLAHSLGVSGGGRMVSPCRPSPCPCPAFCTMLTLE
jgi:hypothetical protein